MAKQHELEQIQAATESELNGDAEVLGKRLFGDHMPDMGNTSDAEALQFMRSKYLSGDRQWLTSEAQRDPEQFLRLSKQLGVNVSDQGGISG